MLKLRRIELFGFKSFYERAEIHIDDSGVTAVVGPNGCGKSNISDAVAWVLGEQSARSLRGQRMEDVIFSGSAKRAPLGMAEVSLHLVDNSPAPPSGNGNGTDSPPPGPVDLVIQRRLFRSGESQYLLNGRLCRLRDINDIFLGTGLGPNSYAIIEQGRIGQILSARPSERRTLVEEAAGVTRFKARKKLAESRLQAAQKNLARVNDILSEVERQRNSLKRQASKARRYREVRKRLREVLAAVFSTRAEVLVEGDTRVAQVLQAMVGEGRSLEGQISALDQRVHGARTALADHEKQLQALRERQAEAQVELEKAQQGIERQGDRVRALETRRDDLTADCERLVEQLAVGTAALESASTRLTELDLSIASLSEEISTGNAGLEELARRRQQEQAGLETARNKRFDIVGREAQLHNEVIGKQDLLDRVGAQIGRVRAELDEAVRATGEAGEKLDSVRSEKNLIEAEIESISRELGQADSKIVAGREELGQAVERTAEIRSRMEAIRHRLATIRDLSVERAWGTESLQTFFSRVRQESWAPAGIVADFLEVEPDHESVIEDLLHSELQYIVVEDLLQTARALTMVRETSRGRLSFFVLDPDKIDLSESVRVEGASPVADFVTLDPKIRSFAALLAGAYVVEDFRRAWDLSQLHPGKTFVARTGEVVRDRIVSWGERSSHGPLSLKREMRELDRKIEEARLQLLVAEQEQQEVQTRLDALATQRASGAEGLREAETTALGLNHQLETLSEEVARAQQRREVSGDELKRLVGEQETLEAGIVQARQDLAEIGQLRIEIDAEMEIRQTEALRLQERLESDASQVAQFRARFAVLGERRETADREIATLKSRTTELEERRQWTEDQIEAATLQRQEALDLIENDQARRDALSGECAELQGRIQSDAVTLDAARDEVRGAETAWDEARSAFDAWKDRHNGAEIEQTQIQSDMKHLVSMCQSELGDTIESVCLDTFETLDPEQLESHEQEHRILRQRLDAMGNVNMMAVEEYEEAEQRFEFLSTQRQDLLDSIRDTTQAISEIDSVSNEQFAEAFKEINKRFGESFLELFGGGRGELRLIEEGENADAGIEIVAQPPGKKLQNVLLLSGGEKALTALALVVALFRFRPSPFCVFDEVDAPLDDANVDRFANMVRQMSKETQFIVITHSKRTMEMANQLYGVTMEEPGVSKVVSVRLN